MWRPLVERVQDVAPRTAARDVLHALVADLHSGKAKPLERGRSGVLYDLTPYSPAPLYLQVRPPQSGRLGGEDTPLRAGFGIARVKGEEAPAVILHAEPSILADPLALAAFLDDDMGILPTFAHEFIHALNWRRGAGGTAKASSMGAYVNSPSELDSFYQEAATHFALVADRIRAQFPDEPELVRTYLEATPQAFVGRFVTYWRTNFGTWDQLTPKNQARIRKRAAGLYGEILGK